MNGFLESEFPPTPADAARFHIIPAPMELSVSYGSGTAAGPPAIITASQQLEAFDGTGTPGDAGIYTAPAAIPADPADPEAWTGAIETAVAEALRCHALPIVLGGEHTATLGAALAFKKAGRHIGFVHFDAHADLRDTYEGSPFSHACVMRRVHELGFPLVQIATRAYSLEEFKYRQLHHHTIRAYDAETIAGNGLPRDFLPPGFPREIFITFDVDAFDPSVMPATGTPVPGGLDWHAALRILRETAAHRTIAGADVVELAPVPVLPYADFTAARLVYALMGLAEQNPGGV